MIKLNVKCNDEIIHNQVNYDSDEVNLFFYPESSSDIALLTNPYKYRL